MGVRRDGKTRWITVNAEPVFRRGEAEPSAVVVSFADITARKQTERLMALPAEIIAIIAAPDSVSETVQRIVAAIKRVTGLDAVGLRLRDGDDYPFAGADGYTGEFLEEENSLAARLPSGGLCRDENGDVSLECTCGLVINGRTDPGNPLLTPGGSAWTNDSLPLLDVSPADDPRLNPRNRCIYTGFRSLALVPLRAGDDVIGLLHLADHHTGRFTPGSIGFFEGLGASIGVALAHQRVLEELRESEKLHRSILKASPDDITVTSLDGEIRKVSASGALMFGFDGEADVIGRSLAEFLVPEDREQARSAIELRLKGGAQGPSEYRAMRVDGSTFPIEVNGDAIRDADGRPTGMVYVVRDVTERRRAEAEIRRLNEELQHRLVDRTEQLDSANQELESFAYAVSHDVRAPLRAIDGFSATVLEDERDNLSEQAVSDLRRVRTAAQDMVRLMDDLLGFTNVTHRDLLPRRVDVSIIAAEVMEELAADEPNRHVEVAIQPDLVAEADAALLRVILRELLGNAWKFTSRHDSARVEVGALDADGERAFYVRDDGAGFDMRYAGHLFGLFQRLHPRGTFPGDGVGLATVQRLVRRHGGRVWAEAEVEQGATFFFTLPAGADPAD
jgi:PAS domain S-box-containing protein